MCSIYLSVALYDTVILETESQRGCVSGRGTAKSGSYLPREVPRYLGTPDRQPKGTAISTYVTSTAVQQLLDSHSALFAFAYWPGLVGFTSASLRLAVCRMGLRSTAWTINGAELHRHLVKPRKPRLAMPVISSHCAFFSNIVNPSSLDNETISHCLFAVAKLFIVVIFHTVATETLRYQSH